VLQILLHAKLWKIQHDIGLGPSFARHLSAESRHLMPEKSSQLRYPRRYEKAIMEESTLKRTRFNDVVNDVVDGM
jgi:hypothetical protein